MTMILTACSQALQRELSQSLAVVHSYQSYQSYQSYRGNGTREVKE